MRRGDDWGMCSIVPCLSDRDGNLSSFEKLEGLIPGWRYEPCPIMLSFAAFEIIFIILFIYYFYFITVCGNMLQTFANKEGWRSSPGVVTPLAIFQDQCFKCTQMQYDAMWWNLILHWTLQWLTCFMTFPSNKCHQNLLTMTSLNHRKWEPHTRCSQAKQAFCAPL